MNERDTQQERRLMAARGPAALSAVTRRRLLGAAVTGGAALAGAGALPAATRARGPARVDVVVVGAGFAGLSAARQIADAGRSVLVLEARDRVGGRVVNHTLADGQIAEAGGQYIGPTQDRMIALAQQFGVATYPTYDVGSPVTVVGGVGTVGWPSPAVEGEYLRLAVRLTELSAEVPVDAPWRAARAREWDSQTLQNWIDANAETPEAALLSGLGDLWGAEPRDVSLLFALFYIAAAGNEQTPGTLARLGNVEGGAQELRFVGGSHVLAQRIADSLGDALVLSAPVRAIDWGADGVRVVADGHTVDAKHVILAVPPALAAAIRYEPQLPTMRAQLLQRLPMGSLMKAEAVYERPFWRDAGLSGNIRAGDGPIRLAYDNTPPSGRPGVILGFIAGATARPWSLRPVEERRSAVLRAFASAVGDAALDPIEYFEVDWPSEQWSRGGPVAYAGPGVLLDYGSTIREPAGPIHWAGTETATYWNGYMEGAVRSGERAASEVLRLLT
jgi:monoamine oxidase